MPAPLPTNRREQVMTALAAGLSTNAVARLLSVSRQTVWRYQRAAAQQGQRVPQPQPMGGRRWSRLQRADLEALSALAVAEPKRTLGELRELTGLPVSLATIDRALHKTGLRKQRARFVDLRTQTEPLIVLERHAFRRAQCHEPKLAAEHLLFMDETTLHLHEQARTAWGLAGAAPPVLFKPKGRAPSTSLFLALGVASDGALLLHFELHPPARAFAAVSATIEASELATPGRGVRVALDASRATVAQLRRVLQQHNVKWTGSRAELLARVRHLESTGPLGLPRAGRVDVGGRREPMRATVREVARFWEAFVAAYAHDDPLQHKTVVWDNAPTHSPVRVQNDAQVSLFHRLFREWGLRGCVFLPPRSPNFQPVELAFAFVKHWVRHEAPPDGYTQAGLEVSIRNALGRISPTMVRNWVTGCGYQFRATESNACAPQQRVPKARHSAPSMRRWADVHGTPRPGTFTEAAAAAAGLADITARALPPQSTGAPSAPTTRRRWPGFPGDEPPAGTTETQPTSFADFLVDGKERFEPERIVSERRAVDGSVEYRIRWKGYAPEQDTWEPSEHLLGGRKQLLRDWTRRQRGGRSLTAALSGASLP